MSKAAFTFLKDQSGITGIEYGVIAFGVALVLISAAGSMGHHLMAAFLRIDDALFAHGAN